MKRQNTECHGLVPWIVTFFALAEQVLSKEREPPPVEPVASRWRWGLGYVAWNVTIPRTSLGHSPVVRPCQQTCVCFDQETNHANHEGPSMLQRTSITVIVLLTILQYRGAGAAEQDGSVGKDPLFLEAVTYADAMLEH